jgi:hypothetical protein
MKSLSLSLLIVCSIYLNVFSQFESENSLSKVVFLELEASSEDSILFRPYSKYWESLDCCVQNEEDYKIRFESRHENLWTVIHPYIVSGELKLYSAFDPYNYTIHDEGELRYPLSQGSYFKDSISNNTLKDILGYYGPQSTTPLSNLYGEDSVIVLADGSVATLYPAPDYIWYKDSHVVKYKLRINVQYNKKGKVIKRYVASIAPVIKYQQYDGEDFHEFELCWIKFDDLKIILKDIYFFNSKGKPETFINYIEKKALKSIIE